MAWIEWHKKNVWQSVIGALLVMVEVFGLFGRAAAAGKLQATWTDASAIVTTSGSANTYSDSGVTTVTGHLAGLKNTSLRLRRPMELWLLYLLPD